jgi:hypothetical protein
MMEEYCFTSDEIQTVFEYLKSNTIVCSLCNGKLWHTHLVHPECIQIHCLKNTCKQKLRRDVLNVATSSIEDEMQMDYEESFKTDKGKVKAGILQDFSRALIEVAKVGTMGINFKGYARGSWLNLEDAEERYLDAFWRHLLDNRDINTEDGDVLVLAQVAWNALARLELKLRREEHEGGVDID